MPAVAPVPFAPFWGHDDNADPLAGGALYAFAAGTDTPLTTYGDPQGTTANPHPVVLDDAGYAHVYLHAGVPYKLRLDSSQGVQVWEIDQVYGSGAGGGSGQAGLGWGKNTVAISPGAGVAQASAAVFPPDVLAVGLTVWCQALVGTTQGLQMIGVGSPDLPDAWGVLPALALEEATTAGIFLAYAGQPKPASGLVSLTAYGGLFDGTGSLLVTGHFYTLTPGQQVGYSYLPGVPEAGQILPPQPPASETVAGILEVATQAEVTAATDDTRAVTPLKLEQRLASIPPVSPASETAAGIIELAAIAEVQAGTDTTRAVTPAGLAATAPTGTALSVARYTASGSGLETVPYTVLSDTKVAFGTTTPETNEHITLTSPTNDELPLAVVATTISVNNQSPIMRLNRRSSGDMVDNFGGTIAFTMRDSAGVDNTLGHLTYKRQGADNSGRFTVRTTNAGSMGSHTAPGELAVDPAGNVSLNVDVFTYGGSRVLALGQGTAPSGGPGNAVQLWSADRGGVALKNSLHVRTEDGTSHVLGDLSGIGTTTPTAPLDINGDTLRLRTPKTPASATAAGNQGDVVWDANFVYVCVAASQWKRAALSTW